MAIHWQIKFKSIGGTLYTVNVYDSDYSGTPVQLTGAADPFITQEDISDDFFQPIRTQSGYLRIYDDGYDMSGNAFDWKNLFPSNAIARPVTLTTSSRTLWFGYIQPQTFSGQQFEQVQVREYPLVCPLAALESFRLPVLSLQKISFARVLRDMLALLGSPSPYDEFSFPGIENFNNLGLYIQYENLLEKDDDGNIRQKYTCMDLLSYICKYFGWTARSYAKGLFFLSPDDPLKPDFVSIDGGELDDYADDYTPTPTTSNWDNFIVDVDDSIYITTDQNEEYQEGVSKVTVTSDINKVDSVITIPFNEILKQHKADTVQHDQYLNDNHYYHIYVRNEGVTTFNLTGFDVILRDYELEYTRAFPRIWDFYHGDPIDKHWYDWKTDITVDSSDWSSSSAPTNALVTFKSRVCYLLQDCVLAIKGTFYRDSYSSSGQTYLDVNSYRLLCRLKVGNMYWTGSTWSNSQSNFYLTIKQDGSTGSLPNTRSLDSSFDKYEGYGIEMQQNMGGIFQFDIFGVLAGNTNYYSWLRISELTFTIVPKLSAAEKSDKNVNKYVGIVDNSFKSEYSVNNILATFANNYPGYGIIVNSNNVNIHQLGYNYGTQSVPDVPEDHLKRRIMTRGSKVRLKQEFTFLATMNSEITPKTMFTYDEFGMPNMYPISLERRWRDDQIKIKALECSEFNGSMI